MADVNQGIIRTPLLSVKDLFEAKYYKVTPLRLFVFKQLGSGKMVPRHIPHKSVSKQWSGILDPDPAKMKKVVLRGDVPHNYTDPKDLLPFSGNVSIVPDTPTQFAKEIVRVLGAVVKKPHKYNEKQRARLLVDLIGAQGPKGIKLTKDALNKDPKARDAMHAVFGEDWDDIYKAFRSKGMSPSGIEVGVFSAKKPIQHKDVDDGEGLGVGGKTISPTSIANMNAIIKTSEDVKLLPKVLQKLITGAAASSGGFIAVWDTLHSKGAAITSTGWGSAFQKYMGIDASFNDVRNTYYAVRLLIVLRHYMGEDITSVLGNAQKVTSYFAKSVGKKLHTLLGISSVSVAQGASAAFYVENDSKFKKLFQIFVASFGDHLALSFGGKTEVNPQQEQDPEKVSTEDVIVSSANIVAADMSSFPTPILKWFETFAVEKLPLSFFQSDTQVAKMISTSFPEKGVKFMFGPASNTIFYKDGGAGATTDNLKMSAFYSLYSAMRLFAMIRPLLIPEGMIWDKKKKEEVLTKAKAPEATGYSLADLVVFFSGSVAWVYTATSTGDWFRDSFLVESQAGAEEKVIKETEKPELNDDDKVLKVNSLSGRAATMMGKEKEACPVELLSLASAHSFGSYKQAIYDGAQDKAVRDFVLGTIVANYPNEQSDKIPLEVVQGHIYRAYLVIRWMLAVRSVLYSSDGYAALSYDQKSAMLEMIGLWNILGNPDSTSGMLVAKRSLMDKKPSGPVALEELFKLVMVYHSAQLEKALKGQYKFEATSEVTGDSEEKLVSGGSKDLKVRAETMKGKELEVIPKQLLMMSKQHSASKAEVLKFANNSVVREYLLESMKDLYPKTSKNPAIYTIEIMEAKVLQAYYVVRFMLAVRSLLYSVPGFSEMTIEARMAEVEAQGLLKGLTNPSAIKNGSVALQALIKDQPAPEIVKDISFDVFFGQHGTQVLNKAYIPEEKVKSVKPDSADVTGPDAIPSLGMLIDNSSPGGFLPKSMAKWLETSGGHSPYKSAQKPKPAINKINKVIQENHLKTDVEQVYEVARGLAGVAGLLKHLGLWGYLLENPKTAIDEIITKVIESGYGSVLGAGKEHLSILTAMVGGFAVLKGNPSRMEALVRLAQNIGSDFVGKEDTVVPEDTEDDMVWVLSPYSKPKHFYALATISYFPKVLQKWMQRLTPNGRFSNVTKKDSTIIKKWWKVNGLTPPIATMKGDAGIRAVYRACRILMMLQAGSFEDLKVVPIPSQVTYPKITASIKMLRIEKKTGLPLGDCYKIIKAMIEMRKTSAQTGLSAYFGIIYNITINALGTKMTGPDGPDFSDESLTLEGLSAKTTNEALPLYAVVGDITPNPLYLPAQLESWGHTIVANKMHITGYTDAGWNASQEEFNKFRSTINKPWILSSDRMIFSKAIRHIVLLASVHARARQVIKTAIQQGKMAIPIGALLIVFSKTLHLSKRLNVEEKVIRESFERLGGVESDANAWQHMSDIFDTIASQKVEGLEASQELGNSTVPAASNNKIALTDGFLPDRAAKWVQFITGKVNGDFEKIPEDYRTKILDKYKAKYNPAAEWVDLEVLYNGSLAMMALHQGMDTTPQESFPAKDIADQVLKSGAYAMAGFANAAQAKEVALAVWKMSQPNISNSEKEAVFSLALTVFNQPGLFAGHQLKKVTDLNDPNGYIPTYARALLLTVDKALDGSTFKTYAKEHPEQIKEWETHFGGEIEARYTGARIFSEAIHELFEIKGISVAWTYPMHSQFSTWMWDFSQKHPAAANISSFLLGPLFDQMESMIDKVNNDKMHVIFTDLISVGKSLLETDFLIDSLGSTSAAEIENETQPLEHGGLAAVLNMFPSEFRKVWHNVITAQEQTGKTQHIDNFPLEVKTMLKTINPKWMVMYHVMHSMVSGLIHVLKGTVLPKYSSISEFIPLSDYRTAVYDFYEKVLSGSKIDERRKILNGLIKRIPKKNYVPLIEHTPEMLTAAASKLTGVIGMSMPVSMDEVLGDVEKFGGQSGLAGLPAITHKALRETHGANWEYKWGIAKVFQTIHENLNNVDSPNAVSKPQILAMIQKYLSVFDSMALQVYPHIASALYSLKSDSVVDVESVVNDIIDTMQAGSLAGSIEQDLSTYSVSGGPGHLKYQRMLMLLRSAWITPSNHSLLHSLEVMGEGLNLKTGQLNDDVMTKEMSIELSEKFSDKKWAQTAFYIDLMPHLGVLALTYQMAMKLSPSWLQQATPKLKDLCARFGLDSGAAFKFITTDAGFIKGAELSIKGVANTLTFKNSWNQELLSANHWLKNGQPVYDSSESNPGLPGMDESYLLAPDPKVLPVGAGFVFDTPPTDGVFKESWAGHLGGEKPKKILTKENGDQFLFKPELSGLRTSASLSVTNLQSLVLEPNEFVPVVPMEHNGKKGSIQAMVPNSSPMVSVKEHVSGKQASDERLTNLSKPELQKLWQEFVFDWLVGNHDGKAANFLKTPTGIIGIDKEQAFKTIGADQLSLSWKVNPTPPLMHLFFKLMQSGKLSVDLESIKPFLDRIDNISDEKWEEAVSPYLNVLSDAGISAKGLKAKLATILQRKNNLRSDLETFLDSTLPGQDVDLTPTEKDTTENSATGAVTVWSEDLFPDLSYLEPVPESEAPSLGGAGSKTVYRHTQTGALWLWKDATSKATNAPKPYASEVQEAFSKFACTVRNEHIPIKSQTIKRNGKIVPGSLQPLLPDVSTLASVSPSELNAEQCVQVGEEHVLDWLFSNHDSHGDNLLLNNETGSVIGADKEQCYRYMLKGGDKLSMSYSPNAELYNEKEPFYNQLWDDYVSGKLSSDFDPKALGAIIERINEYDTKDFLDLLKGYVEKKFPKDPVKQASVLEMIRHRKNGLRSDFENFITDLERTKRSDAKGAFRFRTGWISGDELEKGVTGGMPDENSIKEKVLWTAWEFIQHRGYAVIYPNDLLKDYMEDYVVGEENILIPKDASMYAVFKAFLEKFKLERKSSFTKDKVEHFKFTIKELKEATTYFNAEKPKDMKPSVMGLSKIENGKFYHEKYPYNSAHAQEYRSSRSLDVEIPNTSDNSSERLKRIRGHTAHMPEGGILLRTDSVWIKNQEMTVSRAKNNLGVFYKVRFRLRSSALEALRGKQSDLISYGDPTGEYRPSTGALQHKKLTHYRTGNPLSMMYTFVKPFKRKGSSSIMRIYSDRTQVATFGRVLIHVYLDSENEPLEKQVKYFMGVLDKYLKVEGMSAKTLLRSPSKRDENLRKMHQLAYALAPQWSDSVANDPRMNIETIQSELSKRGISVSRQKKMMANLSRIETLPGSSTLSQKGRWQEVRTDDGFTVIMFGLWATNIAKVAFNQSTEGLMGILARSDRGMGWRGTSKVRDTENGAAGSITCRVIPRGLRPNSTVMGSVNGTFALILAPDLFDRLDAVIYDQDRFGTLSGDSYRDRKTFDQNMETVFQEEMSLQSNEAVLREGIPANKILRINCIDEGYRGDLLKLYAEAGVYSVNGIPVEHFVIVETSCGAIYDKFVAPEGYR